MNCPAGAGLSRNGKGRRAERLLLVDIEEVLREQAAQSRSAGKDRRAQAAAAKRMSRFDTKYCIAGDDFAIRDAVKREFNTVEEGEAFGVGALPVDPDEGVIAGDEAAPAKFLQRKMPGRNGDGEAFGVAEGAEITMWRTDRDLRARLNAGPED